MICPKCNRLNENENIVCRFCDEVLNSEKYDGLTQEERAEILIKPVQQEETGTPPKYRKTGWLLIVGVLALIIIISVFISSAASPSKNAALDYLNAFYNADFQATAQESSVNLKKHYETVNQSSYFDIFGLFSKYSSYDDMLNQYASVFAASRGELEQILGNDFKVKLDVVKEVKYDDSLYINVMGNYQEQCGDILRDGEIQDLRFVYVNVKFIGNKKISPVRVGVNVIKISDEWYVLTDGSLNPYK